MELIRTWGKVGIEGLSACTCILPFLVLPLKLIAKSNALRSGETGSRVADLQICDSRRQLQRFRGIVCPAIGKNRLNQYRWWHRISYDTLGIDPSHPFCCGKPYAAVR